MHIRKHRKKWQCIVRCKGHVVIQSFESKSDARSWGEKTSSELRNGSYQNSDKLISMTLKDLLQLYLEKAMHKSKRPKILKFEVEMLKNNYIIGYEKKKESTQIRKTNNETTDAV